MRLLSLTASVILLLGLIHPARPLQGVQFVPDKTEKLYDPPEDLEASGDDMEDSGSGDDLDLVIVTRQEERSKTANGKVPSDRMNEEVFTFKSSKHFWENKEVVAGCIAGGVTGAVLGFILSAILIYIRRKKQGEESHKKDENY